MQPQIALQTFTRLLSRSYPAVDFTVIQQMREDQQPPQPGPSPVHTPHLSLQMHNPENCESSQNTSQDP